MSHAFAISLTKPHEAFGLIKPLSQRLPQGIVAWNLGLLTLTITCCVAYVVQVNLASAKNYALRDMQTKIDTLNTETMNMQDKIVTLSSMQSLNARAEQLGFAPIDKLEFVNTAGKTTALAQ